MSWRRYQAGSRSGFPASPGKRAGGQGRIKFLAVFFIIFSVLVIGRLFELQIIKGDFYSALAMGQHELYQKLFPERGSIYVSEEVDGSPKLYPLVTNQKLDMLYAVPTEVSEPATVAEKLVEILGLPEELEIDQEKEAELFGDISPEMDLEMQREIKELRREKWRQERQKEEISRLTEILDQEDPYEPLYHRLSEEEVEAISNLEISGLYFKKETWRFYPEKGLGGHLFGFWGFQGNHRQGKYGLEGYFDDILAGRQGEIYSEADIWGNIIAVGRHSFQEKRDGADLVLTLDRAIQYKACQAIYKAVDYFEAAGGVVIVLDPSSGAILALCGAPDYQPDKYYQVDDIRFFNNPAIYDPYEPGSIFKPITLGIALDVGRIEPLTSYQDTGQVTIGPDVLKNFQSKIYGRQTMIEVLEKSINTGAIYAMRQAGPKVFVDYIKQFNFNQLTGVGLKTEVAGDISNLDRRGEIYKATASYGQGIKVTPLQMIAAFSAIANEGRLMKPYLVSEIVQADGTVEKFGPEKVTEVFSQKTATILGGMLVSVVKNGFGKSAAIPGYRVAGKTGTAQIAKKNGRGYSNDVYTSFVGFVPFDDPKISVLVRIDRPGWAKTGSASAAPVFKEVAEFALRYYNIPYDAPYKIE